MYLCGKGKVVTFPSRLIALRHQVRRVDADSQDSTETASKQQEPTRQPVVFSGGVMALVVVLVPAGGWSGGRGGQGQAGRLAQLQ